MHQHNMQRRKAAYLKMYLLTDMWIGLKISNTLLYFNSLTVYVLNFLIHILL